MTARPDARLAAIHGEIGKDGADRVARSVLRQGALFVLVGLLWGLAIPATRFPRLARGPIAARILTAWPWLIWPVVLSERVNAWWGAKNTLPIAAAEAGATAASSLQEGIVFAAHLVGALVLVAFWATILRGLFTERVQVSDVA